MTAPTAAPAPERVPLAYTPKHLADKILQSKSALEGERKQVTVLFADVKGSMELAEQVDAEQWHAILDRFFQILSDGVHRFEGTVNQFTGDGIMALFGAPIAHEDHAQRACYAALQLRDEVARYSTEVKREHALGFSMRMGLHSGEVVVGKIGDDLRMDYTAQGHTVGLAQRMEALASPDTCYLTDSTASLVTGYFELDDLGDFQVKGVSTPVRVHSLKGVGAAQTRFDISRARGLTRFVGRDTDMETLEGALQQARAGNGQVVGVVAEAGTGKSRLCFEFVERLRAQGMNVLEGRAVAHGKNVPYLPMLQVFRAYYGIEEEDDDRTVREKIAGRMLLLDEGFREVLPILFEFFGVPDPERPVPRMQADAKQRQLFAALRRIVQGSDPQAGAGSLVVLIEDLHWLDSGSEAFIKQWVDAVAGSSSFLVVNFRPEYHADWMQKSYYRQLPLSPLGPEAIRELLDDLLGNDPSVRGLAEAVHERTSGNPFFTEEVVRTLIESGHLEGTRRSYRLVTPIDRLEVPPSVRAVLAARIDRLEERHKRLLQTAAVIGKEFAEPILLEASEIPDTELRASLASLEASEFVYEQALYPVVEYAFKHPLTQEVALGSQLQERRRATHAAVAHAIEQAYETKLDEQAALLAHHYTEAGQPFAAASWHARAGEFVGKSNFTESARHWQSARELLHESPDVPGAAAIGARAARELLTIGFRVGMDEDEVDRLFEEGLSWAERAGDSLIVGRLHQSYSVCCSQNSRIEPALVHAGEWERVARAQPDPEQRATAVWPWPDALLISGNLEGALERVLLQLEWTDGHPEWGLRDWDMSARASAHWFKGRVELHADSMKKAQDSLEQGVEIARSVGDRETEGFCYGVLGEVGFMTGEPDLARTSVQRLVELAERIGSSLARIDANGRLGVQLLLDGEPDRAVESLEHSLSLMEIGGASRFFQQRFMTFLADAVRAAGDPARAAKLAEQARAESLELGTRIDSMYAALALSRALRADGASDAVPRIVELLDTVDRLIEATGARNFAPFLLVERAELAKLRGEEKEHASGVRRAFEEFNRIGATGHARRLAQDHALET